MEYEYMAEGEIDGASKDELSNCITECMLYNTIRTTHWLCWWDIV